MVLCMASNPPKDACYVKCIAVDEKFRGRGVGQVFLQRADYEAKKQGCKVHVHYILKGGRYINGV